MRSLAVVRTGWARTVQHAACSQVGTVESGVGETGAALNHSVRSMKNECSKQPKAIHKRVRSRLGSQLARESGVISGGASIEGGLEPAPAAGRSQLQAGVVRGTGCEVLEPSEPGPRAWKECAGGTRLTKTRPARRRRRKTLAEDTVELLDGRRRRARNSCTWNARPLVEVPGTGVDCWVGRMATVVNVVALLAMLRGTSAASK